MQMNKDTSCQADRRRSDRQYPFEEVYWRRRQGRYQHRGILASVSGNGASLLAGRNRYLTKGQIIEPANPTPTWNRPLRVVRMDDVSESLMLVSGPFLERKYHRPGLRFIPESRSENAAGDGRRKIESQLRWRLHHGRRVRTGSIVQYSSRGLIFSAMPEDTPQAGVRIVPASLDAGNRLGFRTALVRRTSAVSGGRRLVFADIES